MKKKFKRLIIFTLTLVITFSSLGLNVIADSSDRISTFISLGAGKQMSASSLEDLTLSKKDLQFLGVYISNFFVPFGTEFGSSDEETTTQNKEDIKKALQTNLKFEDALADELTEQLIGLSRSSSKTLNLYVSKEYQKELKLVPNAPLNYYTVLASMLGGLETVMSNYEKKENAVAYDISEGKYEYGYFGYEKDGKVYPVFDFDIDLSSLTPSNAVFLKCLESVDILRGYGFNALDFTKDEKDGSFEEFFGKALESVDDNQAYKMSMYGSMLNVDCFGNLIVMGGNHQYVAIPACMNPYTWVEVDNTGKDKGTGLGGTVYNIANIPSMSLIEGGTNKLYSSIDKGKGTLSIDNSNILETIQKNYGYDTDTKYLIFREDFVGYKIPMIRGDSSTALNSNSLDWIWEGSSVRDFVSKAEAGFEEANPKAKNYYKGFKGGIVSSFWDSDDTFMLLETKNFNDKMGTTVSYTDKFTYIDDLGAYSFENGTDYSTLNIESYLGTSDSNGSSLRGSMGDWSKSPDNGFTNIYKDIKSGKMSISNAIPKEAMVGLYMTYAISALYNSSSVKETIGRLGYRMNTDSFPSIPDEALVLSDDTTASLRDETIKDWIYYILHPTEGIEYFTTWISNKINGFLLGWHDDMVGTNGTGSINGTTKYRGFSGYVTTPELTDIPWTNSMLNMYISAIPFLLIAMIVIMLGAYIAGILTLQKALIGFGIFAICMTMPPVAINSMVGFSNRFSSSLYGEKFTYWALIQHESYSTAIDEKASSDSYSNYLKELYSKNAEAKGNQGGESIMLRWQAPKKMASLVMSGDVSDGLGGIFDSSLMDGLINSTYSGENYLDDEDSVYLYRSYIDIANFSRYIHRGLLSENNIKAVNLNLTSDITSSWDDSLKTAVKNYDSVYEADRSMGYANVNADGSSSGSGKDILRVRVPMSSSIVTEALEQRGKVKDLELGEYVGINQDLFNFSIPMFNDKDLDFADTLNDNKKGDKDINSYKYSEEDYSGLAAYGLMSENPFYYFSWYLYETGLSDSTTSTTGYKNLLLGEDNAGFFYNNKGNGEMKDFMDMRSLFTYIIPYLRQGNDLVHEWDEVYGLKLYEGVPTEEGHENDNDIKGDKELQQKYWHNLNVARLYNIYTPWVDVMYDCSYAKAEKVSFLGETYVIDDPLNPASYPKERPMIFSRSEMVDYGLKESQLTKVEKLILECQENTQERLFKLLNYHTFNDVVLNTAAAMNCAFEFNKTFSENSIVGANHNIYPQSFELADFSYDAFLRFILSNSTGESMIVDSGDSFYENVVSNSSMTTIIAILVLDILAMYVVPGLKLFFIVGVFIMGILIILTTAFRVDPNQKFVTKLAKSFLTPVIKFALVTCAMAWIVSLFMGEGATAVTGSMEQSIALGDPVMAVLLMIVVNVAVVILYWKILVGVWKDLKKSAKLVGNFVGGVLGSVATMVGVGAVGGMVLKGASNNSSGRSKGTTKSGESSVNSRASARGSSTVVINKINSSKEESKSDRDTSKLNSMFNRNKAKSSEKTSEDIERKTKSGLNNILKGKSSSKKKDK